MSVSSTDLSVPKRGETTGLTLEVLVGLGRLCDEVDESAFEVKEGLLRRSGQAREPDLPLSPSRVCADRVLEHSQLGLEGDDSLGGHVGREVNQPAANHLHGRVVEVHRVRRSLELGHHIRQLGEQSEERLQHDGGERECQK